MNQLTLFDYNALDTSTRLFVETRTTEIKALVKRSAQDIIEIGQKLTEVKARLGHGNFGRWLEAEFAWTQQTAQRFMHVGERFKFNNLLDLNFAPSALYLLSAPSTPDEALEEALERAENGERITHSAAKEIIAEHKIELSSDLKVADWQLRNQWFDSELKQTSLGSYRERNGVKRCENCLSLWMADLDYCPYCHIKPEVRIHYAQQESTRPHVANNSGNNEWYTPKEYIEAARRVLGEIDLDPASSDEANTVVQALNYYTIEDDGLAQAWRGRVWMNPPYASDLIGKFTERLAHHYQHRDVEAAIVLVNNATETRWFQSLAEHATAICFPLKRVTFWSPNGSTGAPLQGQAILYLGSHTNDFIEQFWDFGLLVKAT